METHKKVWTKYDDKWLESVRHYKQGEYENDTWTDAWAEQYHRGCYCKVMRQLKYSPVGRNYFEVRYLGDREYGEVR